MPNIQYTPIEDEESGVAYHHQSQDTSPVSALHRPLIQAKGSYHNYINTALIAVLIIAVTIQSANNFYLHRVEQNEINHMKSKNTHKF